MAKNLSIRFTPSSSFDNDDDDVEYENSITFNDCSEGIDDVPSTKLLTNQPGSEISENNRVDSIGQSQQATVNEASLLLFDNCCQGDEHDESMVVKSGRLLINSCPGLVNDQQQSATSDTQPLPSGAEPFANTDDPINAGTTAGNNPTNSYNNNNSNSVFNFMKKNKNSSSTTTAGAKVSKVDKFVRHLQESFTTSTPVPKQPDSLSALPVSSKSTSKASESGVFAESPVKEEDSISNNSVEALLPATSVSNQNFDHRLSITNTTSPSPTTPTTSWYNDMKLVNSIREKWRSDKKNVEDSQAGNNAQLTSLESPDHRKGSLSLAASSSRRLSTSSVCCPPVTNNNNGGGSSNQVTKSQQSLHCNSCSKDSSDSRCATPIRQPSPFPPYSPYEIIYYSEVDQLPLTDENSNNTMTNDKENSKKAKEMKDLAKKNKLISAASNKKKSSDLSLTFSQSSKSTKPKSSKSQHSPSTAAIASAPFLSIIAPPCSSTNKISSDTYRPPHSSSFENLTAGLYAEYQPTSASTLAINKSVNNKPSSKLPSSKSMVSFRKMKNGTEEILFEESTTPAVPTNQHVNPTLRRKTSDLLLLPETSSPAGSINDDTLSLSSSTSSIETATDALSLQDSLNQSNLSNSVLSFCKPALNVSKANWNSALTPSISHAYYFFSSVVAFISVIFCLISPLPSFFNGFILGLLCTFLLVSVVIVYVFANYILIKSNDSDDLLRRSATPESVSLKRTRSKKLNNSNGQSPGDSAKFSGWVYEFIGEYEEREKNGFLSRLVSVTLYESKLHLYTPSQEMTEKKLKSYMTDPSKSSALNFSSQRIIDFSKLSHKRLKLLLTKNVRNQRKYIWSKKYPIFLEFNDDRSTNGGGYVIHGKETPTSSNPPSPALPKKLETSSDKIKLVIFARTCREKEEWFWALKNAIDSTLPSKGLTPAQSHLSISSNIGESNTDISAAVGDCSLSLNTNNSGQPNKQQYLHILTKRINYHSFMRTNVLNAEGLGGAGPGMMTPLTWFNVLINRLSLDILNKPNWSAYIAKKLQRKLRRLRLPYFLESLTITEIDIGTTLPKFNSVPNVPVVDEAGLWIDFDVNYSGGFTMTLETKVNLLKFKGVDPQDPLASAAASVASTPDEPPIDPPFEKPKYNPDSQYWRGYKYRTPTAGSNGNSNNNNGLGADLNEEVAIDSDSDLDSIVTSSEDEEPETAPADPDDADTDEKQKKLIRFVNKITTSQYFQKATQINFFKKAIEGVSNMSIMLTVQINSLSGTLAINIPETPSDRLWYGFRNDPTIQITARPKLGDHDVNLNYVTNFIEKKLRAEFFNYFVIPNMDDFFIPALNTNIEQNISVVP